MRDVADDRHVEPFEAAFAFADGEDVDQPLGRMFVLAIARVDDMAVGALSEAYNRGIKIPDEISIVGYDNTQIAEMAIPPLTSVSQPLYEMGKKSVEKLFSIIENNENVESTIMMHKIIERSTVKKL